MRKRNNEGIGFTLMEVVIVVMIIATIAALAMPRVSVVIERNRSSEGVGIITALLGSQTRYQLENGAFTGTLANLDITIPASPNFFAPTIAAANPIASIERNSTLYSYTLSISSAGTISCVPSPGICTKIGY